MSLSAFKDFVDALMNNVISSTNDSIGSMRVPPEVYILICLSATASFVSLNRYSITSTTRNGERGSPCRMRAEDVCG